MISAKLSSLLFYINHLAIKTIESAH